MQGSLFLVAWPFSESWNTFGDHLLKVFQRQGEHAHSWRQRKPTICHEVCDQRKHLLRSYGALLGKRGWSMGLSSTYSLRMLHASIQVAVFYSQRGCGNNAWRLPREISALHKGWTQWPWGSKYGAQSIACIQTKIKGGNHWQVHCVV